MTGTTDTSVSYYSLLGISSDATLEEVRAAYRGKLRLWHPDLVAGETEDTRRAATEMTAQLNEAYRCLSDPDRRTTYDARRRARPESTRRTSAPLLVVSPASMRCEVIPGDIVRLTLDVRADDLPRGDGLQVHTSEPFVAANFTVTAQAANSVRLKVRLDTSELGAHHIYQVPIVITWGTLTGAATLVVHTNTFRKSDSASRSRAGPTPSTRRHSTRHSKHRVRDMTTISLGGIVFPLLALAWASGMLPTPTPSHPLLIAGACGGVLAATTWLLTSSRLLRQPERLARIGVVWGHLMQCSGWLLIGGCVVFLGIPVMILTLMVILSAPFLGLVVIALISGRSGSQNR